MILGYAAMEWAIEKYAHFPPEIRAAADALTGTNIITRSRAGWLRWKLNEFSSWALTNVLGGGEMTHGGARGAKMCT